MVYDIADLLKLVPEFKELPSTRETSPISTVYGGSILKRFDQDNISGVAIGVVIACPNVPRPYHSGFHPDSSDRKMFAGDWMDKLVYITNKDFHENKNLVACLSTVAVLLRKAMDHIDSNGCSPASAHTYLRRLSLSGGVATFEEPEGPYAVLATAYVDDADRGATSRMSAGEFWIAAPADHGLIFGGQAHRDALARSAAAAPSDANVRRAIVRQQVEVLRTAQTADPFD